MTKIVNILSCFLLFLMISLFSPSFSLAYTISENLQVQGNLNLQGTKLDLAYGRANTDRRIEIDFNQGGTKIYDETNLHIVTDDNAWLDVPGTVYVQKHLEVGKRLTADSLIGSLTGDVMGNVVGDLTGNVVGDVRGVLTGNVIGNLNGNVTSLGQSAFSGHTIFNGVLGVKNATLKIANNQLTDRMIRNTITASNYLPLSGGTVVGDLTVTGQMALNGASVNNSYGINLGTYDQNGERGINMTLAADTDGDFVYGVYNDMSVGTGSPGDFRIAYGVYNNLTLEVPWGGVMAMPAGIYNNFNGASMAAGSQIAGVYTTSDSYSTNTFTTQDASYIGLKAGGSGSIARGSRTEIFLKNDDGLAQSGYLNKGALQAMGAGDSFYGYYVDDNDSGVTGGTAYGLYVVLNDTNSTNYGVYVGAGDSYFGDQVTIAQNQKLYFDSTDTYIYANTDNPEDLIVGADQDIILEPDNEFIVNVTGGSLTVQPDSSGPNIVGGYTDNSVSSGYGSVISGGGFSGAENTISSYWSTIGGGIDNTISGTQSVVISGGEHNTASGNISTIAGGAYNSNAGPYSFIGGGFYNQILRTVSSSNSVIVGGTLNTIDEDAAVIIGGYSNSVYSDYGVVLGGKNNSVGLSSDYGLAAGRRAKANHSGAFVWADATDADFESVAANTFNVRASSGSYFGTGSMHYYQSTSAKTADYEITANDRTTTFTNQEAIGNVTFTLPAASAGLNYCFYTFASQTIYIDPASGDQIHHLTNTAGDRISNATVGDSICLTAVDGTYWIPTQEVGVWADAN